ncbi:MAG: VTT domain-containing protein [Phycisphaerales bacterium]|nr:VTT domain-containing protein [Phycisphaerales bacterium]
MENSAVESESQQSPQGGEKPADHESIGQVAKRLGPAAWLGVAWTVLPMTSWIWFFPQIPAFAGYLKGETAAGPERIAIGVAVYTLFFSVSAGFGIIPTMTQAALGGYAFGVLIGGTAALVGVTCAATIGYLLADRIAKKRIESEIHSHPKAEIVRDALLRENPWQTLGILILLRMNSPFSLMNYAMNVVGTRLWMYVLATIIGMGPRTFVAAWLGQQASDLTKIDKPKWMVISTIVLTLLMLFIITHIANKALHRITNQETVSPDPE